MNYDNDIIERIKKRPGMYLGGKFGTFGASLTRLDSFLSGYSIALFESGIKDQSEKAIFPLPFCFFNEYLAHYFNYGESTSGWCNMILEQSGCDEEKGFYLSVHVYRADTQVRPYSNIEITYTHPCKQMRYAFARGHNIYVRIGNRWDPCLQTQI